MKTIFTKITSSMLLASSLLMANESFLDSLDIDPDFSKSYIGSSLNIETINGYDPGMNIEVLYGVPFLKAYKGTFSAEVMLTQTVIKESNTYLGSTYDTGYTTLSGLLTYKYELNQKFYGKVKQGIKFYYANSNDRFTSTNAVGIVVSAVGGFVINDKLDLTFGLSQVDVLNGNVNMGAGVNFKF